jgi:hypothetical protein
MAQGSYISLCATEQMGISLLYYYFFWRYWSLNSGLVLARKILYLLSSGYFGDRILLLGQAGLNRDLSTLHFLWSVGWQGIYHHAHPFPIEMESHKLFFFFCLG